MKIEHRKNTNRNKPEYINENGIETEKKEIKLKRKL